MVTNNLQQINTFTGGMDTDTADHLLPSDRYRLAINLRLTTDVSSNSGTLHNIEGSQFIQHLTTNLPTLPEGQLYNNKQILHINTIRDYGIILISSDIINSDYKVLYNAYYIFRFKNNKLAINQYGEIPTLIFGPCKTKLGTTFSSVTRYEDVDNIKFYLADNLSPIRIINVSPSVDATRPMTDDGSFNIYPSALLSQPEFIGLGSGNLKTGAYQYGYQLFTKNGSETEVSPLTSVIYTSSSAITPDTSIAVVGSNKGENTGKSIQFKVKVNDNKYDRIRIVSVFYEEATSIPVIQVLNDSKLILNHDGSIKDVYYQDINNLGVSTITPEEFNMITSVHFIPKLLETKNNHLFASDITYQDNSFDVDYDSRAYSYIKTTTGDLVTILKNNDGVNEMIVTRDNILNKSTIIPEDHDCINPWSIVSNQVNSYNNTYTPGSSTSNAKCCLTKEGSQILYGGEGLNVSWKFRVSEIDGVSEGSVKTGSTYYGCNRTDPTVKARDFEGVWTGNITDTGVMANQKFFRLSPTVKKDVCSYANSVIASRLKSLQRDEVYRYGIVLYNKYNQASSTKWIADIRIPSASEIGFETFIANKMVSFRENKSDISGEAGRCALAVRPLGIEFTVKNLPEGVTSYEIVRCKRSSSDRATVTQGIVSSTNLPELQPNPNGIFPSTYMMNTHCAINDGTDNGWYNDKDQVFHYFNVTSGDTEIPESNQKYMMTHMTDSIINFTSPEVCFNRETLKETLPKTGLKLHMVKFLYGNGSAIPLADRNSYIYASTFGKMAMIRKTDMKPPFQPLTYETYAPYFYTPDNGVNESICLYEQANYCKRTNGISGVMGDATSGDSSSVTNLAFPTETNWSDFRSKLDFVDGINAFAYTDWNVNRFSEHEGAILVDNRTIQGPHGRSIILSGGYPMGSSSSWNALGAMIVTGDRLVNESDSVLSSIKKNTLSSNAYYNESVVGVQLCNLRKNIVPYGGYNYSARQFNTYISIEGFNLNSGVSNTNTIFGGDIFIGAFEYVNLHYFAPSNDDGSIATNVVSSVKYNIPCESTINIAYKNSAQFNKYVQINPSNVNGKYVQDKPLYAYNSVYSVEPSARLFTATNQLDEFNRHLDCRTCYSLSKNNDEVVDQWSKFKPLNYLDVDSKHGSINNIRTFGNELIFWQSNAVGKLSVNERTLITDDSEQALLLGTGGVLSRYDYIATVNGMSNGHNDSDCQSDTVLYWFDHDRKELCAYSNGSIICISKAKHVQNYINTNYNKYSTNKLFPKCEFDKKYNEMYFNYNHGSEERVLVWNEALQIFTGVLDCDFKNVMKFDSDLYYIKNEELFKLNGYTLSNSTRDRPLNIELQYIVNNNHNETKVFDNVETTGTSILDDIIWYFSSSSTQRGTYINKDYIKSRDDNHRFAIPRFYNSERIRGRVLYCKYNGTVENYTGTPIITNTLEYNINTINNSEDIITNNSMLRSGTYMEDRFSIPYIRTTYRISKS